MSEDTSCNYQNIANSPLGPCEYVKLYCSGTYVNFYELHFCSLDERLYITLPIFIILTLYCFRLLSSTANIYLSSSLTTISERLGMSQNLAGVTFLALGNGAPDVIASIVASDPSESENINFALAALLGGGIFITTLVFFTVIFYAKKVKVEKHLFLRDIIFYIVTNIGILLMSINRKIGLLEAIIFLSLYLM